MLNILFVADVFAKAGRRAAAHIVPRLIRDRNIDFCVVNGENAAGGFGLTENIVRKFKSYGADVITTGNHVWDRKDFLPVLNRTEFLLRPCNYPREVAGKGTVVATSRSNIPVGVINLQGRTHLPSIDCPFRAARAAAETLRRETPIVLIDFHAEATAEKVALGWHMDGLVSAVIGTHTHVQTADERILPRGTAYLTDAGMTGPHDSVIGVRSEIAIRRFLTQTPIRFKPAEENAKLCGAIVAVDEHSGSAKHIERLQLDLESGSTEEDEEGD